MRIWRRTSTTVVMALLVIGGALFPQFAQAATGSLYISPASTSINKGGNLTATLRLNPGQAVDTVTATVTYDASKLKYNSVSYGGSPFTTQIPGPVNSGSVTISSAFLGGSVSSDSFVASFSFTALTGSGSSAINVSGNAARSGVATNPSTKGETVSFTTPAPSVCPPGQIGTPPNCTTPTPTPTPTPSPTPTPTPTPTPSPSKFTPSNPSNTQVSPPASQSTASPLHPSVSSTHIQYTLANMTVITNASTRVYVRYGLVKDALNSQTNLTSDGTVHDISLDPSMVLPGQTYYYQVVAQGSEGQTEQSSIQTFQTKGLTIKVGVFDKNHQPVKGKEVTLHSRPQTSKTDDSGVVTFFNVTPGDHSIDYVKGDKTYSQPFIVANNVQTVGGIQQSDTQNFSVVYNFEQGKALPVIPAIIALLVIVALVVLVALIRRSRRGGGIYGGGGTPLLNPITVGGTDAQQTNIPGVPTDVTLSQRLESIPAPPATLPGTVISSNDINQQQQL